MMDDKEWEPKKRIELQFQRSLIKIGEQMNGAIDGLTDPFDILSAVKSILKNMVFH